METAVQEHPNIYTSNLTEALETASLMSGETEVTLSIGEMWMQKKLDVSYSVSAALGKLSSWHKRQTVVLSQLRSWTERNDYATTLTVQKLLESWSLGSALLTELIETGVMCAYWEEEFLLRAPTLIADLGKMYPPE